MKTLFLTVLFVALFSGTTTYSQVYCPNQDSLEWDKLTALKKTNPKQTFEAIGSYFLGKPYVAGTLEVTEDTALVVNFSGLDCVTFVETVMGIVRVLHSDEQASFTHFTHELTTIRYRDRVRNGYLSRLHYTSEWLEVNEKKYIGKVVSGKSFNQKTFTLNFMSTHRKSYPLLASHENFVGIQAMEKRIKPSLYMLEKSEIRNAEQDLKHGDMIGILTSIKGLDIAHTGFIYKKKGVSYLLHASSVNKKVEISAIPLHDYLAKQKSNTGIVVFRWLDSI